jgi:hypothetical protein
MLSDCEQKVIIADEIAPLHVDLSGATKVPLARSASAPHILLTRHA